MKKLLVPFLLFFNGAAHAQEQPVSKEAFINSIFDLVTDGHFSKYYLLDLADPCSFKRYDYGEWVKHGLREPLTINILNELAKNSWLDTAKYAWQQQKLNRAICIDNRRANAILTDVPWEHLQKTVNGKKGKPVKKAWRTWNKKPIEDKLVFYFSKPEFTADFRYAVINVVYRCDDQSCGMGATYIFHHTDDNNWKLAGKMISWGG